MSALRFLLLVLWPSSSFCNGSPVLTRVSPAASHSERMAAARILLDNSPLIDGHNDLPWNLRMFLHNKLHSFNFSADLQKEKPWRAQSFSQTDLPRLKKGKVAAQFWSIYVPCEAQYLNTVQLLLEQVDVIKRMIAAHQKETIMVTDTSGILREFHRGRLASLMGMEGGHALGSSMGVVRSLYDLGVRYITLTHKCHTPWAECADKTKDQPNSPGLTPYGKKLVLEMNRLGMMVDLSHSSSQTVLDVLSITRAPVIFSHSGVRKICPINRNVEDSILKQMPENGGVVLISFYNEFLTCSKYANITNVIEHINHVRNIAGVDHVGIGAGYDGINRTPIGLDDVSYYPELFTELLKDPSWSLQDLKKLAGVNLMRVMDKVQEIREDLMSESPGEDIIPIHDIDSRWPCRYKFASLEEDIA
ncbi:unnamed protein product [Meganyctiphanes norvegica]|uniref:Dipeptidase n=1 Tax=Meganyctiphanes norvegica TaxID=48144 RepID=A0AAV2SC36_MEGNR